ncbi:cysteine protease StiP domain-containing protein [Deinococcus altitudinis]|uniref:cysteine protease StiP domain-containing protein n=1 Tax=Deinococcus altitudinis TaxID=468914 RepID=UPI00389298EC
MSSADTGTSTVQTGAVQASILQTSPVQTSYAAADIRLLIGAARAPQVSLQEKEARIAAGESYGHFLTPEAAPTDLQTATYHAALKRNGPAVASALLGLADRLAELGQTVTLVSLARAGFPVGVLLHRLLLRRGLDSAHYGVSIVRGVGLDMAALGHLLTERPADSVVFVDGWTGKGSILHTLTSSLEGHAVRPRLAALYDPAGVAEFAGSHADLLLPHAALNATVSGLVSRSFLSADRHAAAHLDHLRAYDLSNAYVDALDGLCRTATALPSPGPRPQQPAAHAFAVARRYGCTDPHRAKPGVGEATRVFLRRQPAALVLRASTSDTAHLETLAREGNVPVHVDPLLPYAAMSLIREGQRD